MIVTKCVWQYHSKREELQPVFDYFREITNEAIRLGIEKNITSRFKLHHEAYFKLRSKFHSRYVLGAILCATSRLNQFKQRKKKDPQAKTPYIHKNHLVLDNQSYKIVNENILIPISANTHCSIRLNHYVLRQIQNVKLGAITITEDKIVLGYSRQVTDRKPSDFVAIDRNLDNATTFDTKYNCVIYDLQMTNQIKRKCKQKIARFRRNDARIRQRILAKYGKKEKNKVNHILHLVSKKIIEQNMGVILEDLKGIRKLYRRGNGQGKKYRAKMNSWSFFELQRQIEYKARWLGLPVTYVKASGTSSKCAVCGAKMIAEEHRQISCPCCKTVVDRDINAAKNILARGIRFMPVGAANEAMVEDISNPQSRCIPVIHIR